MGARPNRVHIRPGLHDSPSLAANSRDGTRWRCRRALLRRGRLRLTRQVFRPEPRPTGWVIGNLSVNPRGYGCRVLATTLSPRHRRVMRGAQHLHPPTAETAPTVQTTPPSWFGGPPQPPLWRSGLKLACQAHTPTRFPPDKINRSFGMPLYRLPPR
jgi:hypothetical protein